MNKWGNIPQWITALIALSALLLGIFTDKLPTTERLKNVVEKEGKTIVEKNQECVKQCVSESTQKIIATLVNYRKSEEAVRNEVYKDALEQTAKGKEGYIYKKDPKIEESYLTAYNWRDREKDIPVLLTENEEAIIQAYFNKYPEKGLYSLMYLVLSDDNMNAVITYDVEYYEPNRPLGNNGTIAIDEQIESIRGTSIVTKKTTRHLSHYEKIGIIGGYLGDKIDEIRSKHTKLSEKVSK